MAKYNRICLTCKSQYSYCPSCSADKAKPTWMNIYCSENCRTLFNASSDFFAGDMTKEQAKEIVDKADLSKMADFNEGVVKMINAVKMIQNDSFKKSVAEANKVVEKKENKAEEKSDENKVNKEKHNRQFDKQNEQND